MFENVLNSDQIEIFSNPKKNVILDSSQSEMIRKLIERLNYIEKSDLKIRKRIDDRYVTELFEYTHNSSNVLMKQFKKAINDSVLNYINKKKTLLGNVEEQANYFVF